MDALPRHWSVLMTANSSAKINKILFLLLQFCDTSLPNYLGWRTKKKSDAGFGAGFEYFSQWPYCAPERFRRKSLPHENLTQTFSRSLKRPGSTVQYIWVDSENDTVSLTFSEILSKFKFTGKSLIKKKSFWYSQKLQ